MPVRVVILGVLRDVAEFLGFADALADLAPPDGLEVNQLLLELRLAFDGKGDLSLHSTLLYVGPLLCARTRRAEPLNDSAEYSRDHQPAQAHVLERARTRHETARGRDAERRP